MTINRILVTALLSGAVSLVTGGVAAQTGNVYPVKPVGIVVPYSAGGTNDVVARLLATALSEQLKQPFVVENRPGGNGISGANYVANATPDGYTLLFGNTTLLAIQVSLFSKLPYDPQRDFSPVTIIGILPSVLVVHPSVPARSVKELAALAKANPGKMNYASAGNGTPFHLSAELLKSQTGTDMTHVPYKGNAPAIVDLLAGRVQMMFANALEVVPNINAGKLRAIATTGTNRLSSLPDVQTMAESGFKSAESFAFLAIVAPKGTPKTVIARLNAEIVKVQARADVQEHLHKLGIDPVANSPAEAEAFLREQVAKWAEAVTKSGAKVDN